ncbi:hypothetical protein JKP88DRAFT_348948 [Tribonema minus]|uniref:Uncharacterized protein n=1 Tax=Tribonema minus TaxID=303371 RepID=A0A835Z363_9STRA|nr:hypothetical protein JKP88DRAFT_348948 [Tribonema minus]
MDLWNVGAVVMAVREADRRLALITRQTGCAAVLSNDTDFLIYDAPGFIPFWGLDVSPEAALAFVFSRQKLARTKAIVSNARAGRQTSRGLSGGEGGGNDYLPDAPDYCHAAILSGAAWGGHGSSRHKGSRAVLESVGKYLAFKTRLTGKGAAAAAASPLSLPTLCAELCGSGSGGGGSSGSSAAPTAARRACNRKKRRRKGSISDAAAAAPHDPGNVPASRPERFLALLMASIAQYDLAGGERVTGGGGGLPRSLHVVPSVTQAVTEGVFWGGVVLEDSSEGRGGAWLQSPSEQAREQELSQGTSHKRIGGHPSSATAAAAAAEHCCTLLGLERGAAILARHARNAPAAADVLAAVLTAAVAQRHSAGPSFLGLLAFIAAAAAPPSVPAECGCLCACRCACGADNDGSGGGGAAAAAASLEGAFVCEWAGLQVVTAVVVVVMVLLLLLPLSVLLLPPLLGTMMLPLPLLVEPLTVTVAGIAMPLAPAMTFVT